MAQTANENKPEAGHSQPSSRPVRALKIEPLFQRYYKLWNSHSDPRKREEASVASVSRNSRGHSAPSVMRQFFPLIFPISIFGGPAVGFFALSAGTSSSELSKDFISTDQFDERRPHPSARS
jgi:hypothetical protein